MMDIEQGGQQHSRSTTPTFAIDCGTDAVVAANEEDDDKGNIEQPARLQRPQHDEEAERMPVFGANDNNGNDNNGTSSSSTATALAFILTGDGGKKQPQLQAQRGGGMMMIKSRSGVSVGSGNGGKPHARFQMRTLCLIGALLPGLGCYTCLFYTFLFQQERVRNFTSASCPNVQSPFPPVSYSIGVWEPQKSIWLFVLFLHVPARLFFGIAYKAHFELGESEYKQRNWYPCMVKAHLRLILVEIIGLVAVSVVDIDHHFVLHALFYALWLTSFNFNMLFNTLLFHHSGVRLLRKPLDRLFYLKCALAYGITYPLSMSTGVTYFSYWFTCNSLAYALFSLAEYVLVGSNSLFYFLMVWELKGCELELYVRTSS